MRLGPIFILYFIVGVGVLESEAVNRKEEAPKKMDVGIVIDQAGPTDTGNGQGIKKMITDVGMFLLDHTWISAKFSIVILGGKGSGNCAMEARLLKLDVFKDGLDFANYVEKNLVNEIKCPYIDRKGSPNRIVEKVWQQLRPGPNWRRETPKMLIWFVATYAGRGLEPGRELFKVKSSPEIVLSMYNYHDVNLEVYENIQGVENKITKSEAIENFKTVVENYVKWCDSDVSYDSDRCYFRMNALQVLECFYDKVYTLKEPFSSNRIKTYCTNGTENVECDLAKCKQICESQPEQDYGGQCLGPCGSRSTVMARPKKTAAGDPFYKDCPWANVPCVVECTGAPTTSTTSTTREMTASEMITSETATSSTTSTSTSTTSTTKTTTKPKMESWLIAVIVVVGLIAIALIVVAVVMIVVCSKKRSHRRRSVGQEQRARSPRADRRTASRSPNRRPTQTYDSRRAPPPRRSPRDQYRDRRRR